MAMTISHKRKQLANVARALKSRGWQVRIHSRSNYKRPGSRGGPWKMKDPFLFAHKGNKLAHFGSSAGHSRVSITHSYLGPRAGSRGHSVSPNRLRTAKQKQASRLNLRKARMSRKRVTRR